MDFIWFALYMDINRWPQRWPNVDLQYGLQGDLQDGQQVDLQGNLQGGPQDDS